MTRETHLERTKWESTQSSKRTILHPPGTEGNLPSEISATLLLRKPRQMRPGVIPALGFGQAHASLPFPFALASLALPPLSLDGHEAGEGGLSDCVDI